MEPSHDVFVDEVDVVASIVVAPLLVGPACVPYGALYVTHHLPIASSLDSLKGKVALSRLAALVQLLLVQRSHKDTWAELVQVRGSGGVVAHTPRVAGGQRLRESHEPRPFDCCSTAEAALLLLCLAPPAAEGAAHHCAR